MSLLEKYVKFINSSHLTVSGIFLVIPPSVLAYLFFPDVIYTTRLVVSGILCVIIFSAHVLIGISGVIKKEFETVLNFLLVPLGFICLALFLGFT